MTNKHNNWTRILQVINYLGLNPNTFAIHLGMLRSENIYHIKRGNYGISEDLADRIVELHPEIDRTWLLSGIGDMFKNKKRESTTIPFYNDDIHEVLPNIETATKSGTYRIPYACDCDMVIRSKCDAMNDPGTAATDLFLKGVEVADMVQGNEYVMIINNEVLWRKIRHVKGNAEQWRLVSRDREEFPDIVVNLSEIRGAWRVISRTAILVS